MARNKNIEVITKVVEYMQEANCGPTNGLSIKSLGELTGLNYHSLYRIIANESNGFLRATNVDDYNSACYYHDVMKMAEILGTDTSNRTAKILAKVDPYLFENEKKTEKLIFDLSSVLHMLDRDGYYAKRINWHLEKGAAKQANAKSYFDWLFKNNTAALKWFTENYKAKTVTDHLEKDDYLKKLDEKEFRAYSKKLMNDVMEKEDATVQEYVAASIRITLMGITVAHKEFLALGGDKD